MQGLLSEAMPQEEAMAAQQGAMSSPNGEMSDVDMAMQDALASGDMDEIGFGVVMASEEEQQTLEAIMDDIEDKIHGAGTQDIVGILKNNTDKFHGIAQASHLISMTAFMKANADGLEPSIDVLLAENGVVQQTVEMVFEVAEAIGAVTMEDDEELTMAYMDTMRLVGENLLEMEDPEIVASAQEFMAELELDMPIDQADYSDLPPEDMASQAQAMAEQQQMEQQQMPQQGGMPPMGPMQGMV